MAKFSGDCPIVYCFILQVNRGRMKTSKYESWFIIGNETTKNNTIVIIYKDSHNQCANHTEWFQSQTCNPQTPRLFVHTVTRLNVTAMVWNFVVRQLFDCFLPLYVSLVSTWCCYSFEYSPGPSVMSLLSLLRPRYRR